MGETGAIRTPEQRVRVFVSSTLGELAAERQAVRDAVTRLDLTLGTDPPRWQLEIRADATEAQKRNLADWIGL